jgi:hypothetical protein
MNISYAEAIPLTCPRCGTPFVNDTYIIVDAAERPDLVAKIIAGTLHDAACPNCGEAGRVPAPLLYHNRERERVLLAVPPGMPEAEWREVGQTLLWTLIGALPQGARTEYLGDVQAEAGLEGVAQVITAEGLTESTDADEELPPIVPAIQALLDAQGAQQLQRAFEAHPILDDPQAVAIMQELAAEALKHGEMDAAQAFAHAAELLEQVKTLRARSTAQASDVASAHGIAPDEVEELAFALLRSTTGQQLAQVVDQHPVLLEAWADDMLQEWAEQQRQADKPRIAEGIDERRAALAEMRKQYQEQQPALDAVQAYLQAQTDDEIEAVIVEHDALLSDTADQTLQRLAASAHDDGDETFAAFVKQRRAFLQHVREAIDS